MSTKAIRDVLETVAAGKPLSEDAPEVARQALEEMAAISEAARTLDRLSVGDVVYGVRCRSHVLKWSDETGGNSWHHPDVKAWSDASVLLGVIAKEEWWR